MDPETVVYPGIFLISEVHENHCFPNPIRILEQRLLVYSEQSEFIGDTLLT